MPGNPLTYWKADIHRTLVMVTIVGWLGFCALDASGLIFSQNIHGRRLMVVGLLFFVAMLGIHLRYPTQTQHFWGRVAALSWPHVLVYLLVPILFMTPFLGAPFVRRLFFLGCYIHTIPIVWPPFRAVWSTATHRERGALGLLAVLFLVLLIPGFYFPPFFNGICGWNLLMRKDEPAILVDYKFVRDDGKEIWVSPIMSSPSTFNWRHITWAHKRSEADQIAYTEFLLSQYRRYYPLLLRGTDPNEQHLGHWSYPGHNDYRHLDYSEFPPERIVKVAYVDERYERPSLKPLTRSVKFYYDVHSKRMVTLDAP